MDCVRGCFYDLPIYFVCCLPIPEVLLLMTEDSKTPSVPDDSDAEQDIAVNADDQVEASDEGGAEGVEDDKNIVLFNNQIEILPDDRLRHLDKGPVKAYAAKVVGEPNALLFAMVCEPHLVPRTRAAPNYAGIINSVLTKMVTHGAIYWPPARAWRYCFIYVNNLGRSLAPPGEIPVGLGWRQDQVTNAVIKPMVNLLLDMRDADFVHGNIRVDNMFDGNEKAVEKIILGECLSTPPSYTQSILYEPIERAMCDPVARGRGTQTDDLYAFAVSLAVILRKKDALVGMSDEEILHEKIDKGSYAALTGKDRFTGGVLELLRGLLYDDPAQRWGVDDILVWMEGQRLTPKQSTKKKKATRPLFFNGDRYYRQSILAMDLNKSQTEAVQMVDNGNLDQWITRSLEDNIVRSRVVQAIETTQEFGRGSGYWDRLLSRVSVALDPDAPLRFKGLSVHPDGVGYSLAEAFVLKHDLQPYVDIINQQLVTYWTTNQTDIRIDIGSLVHRFDSCRAFLRQGNIGYGVERCLYHLCPEAPCMSDRLRKYSVHSPEDMMYAFEDMSSDPDRPELFIDRHIAAFISTKDRKDIDPYLGELNSEEYYKRVLGNLKVLATIQKRSQMEMFPGITKWLVSIIDPVLERYHDRDLRERMVKSVEKLKDSGDIMKMATIFDSGEVMQRDAVNFKISMKEHTDLQREYETLEKKMDTPAVFSREVGREIAAIVSGILAAIIILAFGFLYFVQRDIGL